MSAIRAPTDQDVRWITQALGDEQRKWLIVRIARRSGSLAETFLVPMLDAAIDEVDPSSNRWFIEPCVEAFGNRRVIEYLLGVIESGSDFCKAGAANALYWAQVPLCFQGKVPSFAIEHATPESRVAYEALSDLRERERQLLIATFVFNASVDVRRSIIPHLSLNPAHYPESHQHLISQAVEIARSSDDDYIRQRVETQLGKHVLLFPLPHREKRMR